MVGVLNVLPMFMFTTISGLMTALFLVPLESQAFWYIALNKQSYLKVNGQILIWNINVFKSSFS